MKILFCGTMVPDEIEYQVQSVSAAGNRFQNNMIQSLKLLGHQVRQCSFLGVPISQEVKEKLQHREDQEVVYILKENHPVKSIWEYGRRVKHIMNDTDIVMCYNVTYAWLLLPYWSRKKKKSSIVIVADYSESISYRSIVRKFYAKIQLWSMRQFETVVGLSENIRQKIKRKQQFVLMEGGIDRSFYNTFYYRPYKGNAPICFMYSGLLSPVTGVDILLEAMEQIKNQNILLIITGKGPLEEMVKQAALKDDRICYKGHLTYEEYIEQLQAADVLLNPRNMNLPENQNNFPSKIMDYLTAGKPIISTRFAGWKKFTDNIIFTDCSAKELAAAIDKITIKDTDDVFIANRKMAASFLWDEQVKKIL